MGNQPTITENSKHNKYHYQPIIDDESLNLGLQYWVMEFERQQRDERNQAEKEILKMERQYEISKKRTKELKTQLIQK